MKRILFVLTGTLEEKSFKSNFIYFKHRLDILKEKGYFVKMIAPAIQDEGKKIIENYEILYITKKKGPIGGLKYMLKVLLYGITNRNDFDILWAESPIYDGLAASLLGVILNKKTMLFMQGFLIRNQKYLIQSKIKQLFSTIFFSIILYISFNLSNNILAVNREIVKEVSMFCFNTKKIFVIPNNIDPKLVPFKIVDKKYSKSPEILFVGRFVKFKGIEYLIESFKIVNKSYPNAKLILIGSGEEEQKLRKMVNDININCVFPGFLKYAEIFKYQRRAWCFVTTSPICNFSFVTMEAILSKTPVIATDVGATEELIRKDIDALLVPLNTEKIAEAIIKIIEDRQLGEKLSKNALDHLDIYRFDNKEWCKRLLKFTKM